MALTHEPSWSPQWRAALLPSFSPEGSSPSLWSRTCQFELCARVVLARSAASSSCCAPQHLDGEMYTSL